MTPQSPKPSCHDVITRRWNPSGADKSAGPGYGVTTNIINGGLECGKGGNAKVEDGIGFYKRYCDLLGVGYGNNQKPLGPISMLFNWVVGVTTIVTLNHVMASYENNCNSEK
ncbi:unnamed protein product [Prunus armeniaca]|uniref:Glycoside hydrolase family 19 catalytic domain-containing protein n=1 Tax=Prunus armeniaca TaxID=36596 RepID=A0A6J5WI53_PRUAR|nr:unnamed protein product [Prunus armeniaca]